MKLIQANIWGGKLLPSILRLLQEQQPDFIHMQEVFSTPSGETMWFNVLEEIQAQETAHTFFSPLWDHLFGKHRNYWGNAIISKLPFKSTYDEFTHLDYRKDFEFDDHDYNIRKFQHAVIDLSPGKHINLVNYHGYHISGTKTGNELTVQHCQRIADYIKALKGPVILSGDFNLAPDSASLKPLNNALINLCDKHAVETTRNSLAKSMTTVDYIWVSKDIKVNHFEVLPNMVSDHAALLLDFDI
jgi:endonuclease/exonuclease/phosphatase family metal-dependent hydrolase